ncbi:hypothetical protein HX744_14510 [Pseudonocardia sp. ICBG1122]|nr:hypothetical protein [Pseudonocardia pini]
MYVWENAEAVKVHRLTEAMVWALLGTGVVRPSTWAGLVRRGLAAKRADGCYDFTATGQEVADSLRSLVEANDPKVTDVGSLSDEVLSTAYAVEQEGPTDGECQHTSAEHDSSRPCRSGGYGVIVHSDRGHKVVRCGTAEYRDDTLVPFFSYYDSVSRVETFGPSGPADKAPSPEPPVLRSVPSGGERPAPVDDTAGPSLFLVPDASGPARAAGLRAGDHFLYRGASRRVLWSGARDGVVLLTLSGGTTLEIPPTCPVRLSLAA